nr:MAG TPA: hypothetical protein [Caudoviricetes sp.]
MICKNITTSVVICQAFSLLFLCIFLIFIDFFFLYAKIAVWT